MQSEKKIKTIQEEISFCRDIGVREGLTFPRSVRLHFEETKNKRKMLEQDFQGQTFRDRLRYLHYRNILLHSIRIGLPSTVLHFPELAGY